MSEETDNPPAWQVLFVQALKLIEEISRHGRTNPFWTFGGGTALMLRFGHRLSKDIDIFVPDPQSLGFVNPRLSDVAEIMAEDYEEAANYIKLFLAEGEIDFVAAPNLTSPGFTEEEIMGHKIRIETPEEIIAKKFWHRGDRITGRDIFDFALVAERAPDSLPLAAQFVLRHSDLILHQLDERNEPLRRQFEAVQAQNFHPTFDKACGVLRHALSEMQNLNNDIG
jgi:predicted nucleotidyltransferase component of viral defense system